MEGGNSMTYKELKINVLQKVGDSRNIQNGEIILNTSTQTYISQIPNLLQEALRIVSTSGRYIVKYLDIVNIPIESGLPDKMRNIYTITEEDMTVELENAQAYYFEVSGKAKIELTLINNLRNILGPHHLKEGECYMVCPFSFFKEKCIWASDPEEKWDSGYCFVEMGV